jgi:hypothetical protein
VRDSAPLPPSEARAIFCTRKPATRRFTRNGLRFVSGDYPRAVFMKSSSIAISGEIASASTLGAFFFVRDGFGVVIAFASGESASNHFSLVAFGAFGACVVVAFGADSFAISANIARNEPSASVTASSFDSSSHLSESARSEDDAMRNFALGVPSFVNADSRRFTSDFETSADKSNIPTTAVISFLFIFRPFV